MFCLSFLLTACRTRSYSTATRSWSTYQQRCSLSSKLVASWWALVLLRTLDWMLPFTPCSLYTTIDASFFAPVDLCSVWEATRPQNQWARRTWETDRAGESWITEMPLHLKTQNNVQTESKSKRQLMFHSELENPTILQVKDLDNEIKLQIWTIYQRYCIREIVPQEILWELRTNLSQCAAEIILYRQLWIPTSKCV